MFEKILAGAEPSDRLYVNLYLQDGIPSLGKAQYALKPGSKAALAGTLMRIAGVVRDGSQLVVESAPAGRQQFRFSE